jgi:hypothetical protein
MPGLAIILISKPHPRHADIVGWDTDRRKHRLQAEKLADDATLVLAPAHFVMRPLDADADRARLRVCGIVLAILLAAMVALVVTLT